MKKLIILTLCIVVGGCQQDSQLKGSELTADSADIIFVGNNILTMDEATEGATGVAIRDDKIIFVGDKQTALGMSGSDSRVIELGDRALIPGFVDSHGHIAMLARYIDYVNLSAPPVGSVKNIPDLIALLTERLNDNPPTKGKWLVGYGYDDSLLAEGRHPTRDDLDKVSTEVPIYLAHVSGHLGALNSAALTEMEITSQTPNPVGGVIRRQAGSSEPNGVLEEKAAAAILFKQFEGLSAQDFVQMVRRAVRVYASNGITTAQDGAASQSDINALREAAANNPFAIDIGAYAYTPPGDAVAVSAAAFEKQYTGGFRVAGTKISLDGSPQGRTAWLSQPYTEGPPGADENYVAYPTVKPDDYIAAAKHIIRSDVPLLVHANGDAAMDLMLRGVQAAKNDGVIRDNRTVIIHAQLMREDQLDLAATLGVVPSFFSAHTFFWGDWHLKSFGQKRGQDISPTRWAKNRSVPFTIHNDAPVVPPDMMRLVWATVNRATRDGEIIGEGQRLSVEEALYAATQAGAYQFFEEDSKGSISVGKQADLVILESNPVTIEPMSIQDVGVLETFARGKSIYTRK